MLKKLTSLFSTKLLWRYLRFLIGTLPWKTFWAFSRGRLDRTEKITKHYLVLVSASISTGDNAYKVAACKSAWTAIAFIDFRFHSMSSGSTLDHLKSTVVTPIAFALCTLEGARFTPLRLNNSSTDSNYCAILQSPISESFLCYF